MSADREPGSGATQKLIAAIAPLLLIGLNLLVFGTFAVYGENRGEFLISYSSALRLYYLPALAVFIALGLLSLAFGPRSRRIFNALILFFGVITYIHSNLLLWHTGVLDGTALDFSKTWRSLVDAIVWLTLAWAAFRYRNWLMLQGWKICVVLILFQTIGMFSILYNKQQEPTAKLATLPKQLEMFSTHTNVIHIVLDGFQANVFEDLLRTQPKLTEDLSGFTFFRDATTPSDVTYLSVPATLSGKPFTNQVSISKYLDETLHGDNLYRFLASKNFAVDVATPLWWNQSNSLFSSYYRIPTPYAGQQETLRSNALLLADLSLYRQAPHFLKPMVYRSGTWLLSAKFVSNPEQQFEHFAHNSFVNDLQNKISVTSAQPRYKFIHLVTPHAPFVSSSDCSFAGATLEYSKEAFTQQSLCTLKVIIAFLDQLKASGIYDNAMLIIHGDHGGGVPFDMLLENGDKTNSTEALYRMWGNPLPLVLIKPPGATGSLHISDQQVQLLDVPVTVTEQLGFSSEFPGKSMFEDNHGADVERVFFNSKIHRNAAMTKDSFDEFTRYRITGSVYRVASWQQAESFEAPVINNAGQYVWNTRISFGNHGNYRDFRNGGWVVTATEDVTWTEGSKAGLSIDFPEISSDVIMRVKIKPLLAPGKLDQQHVNIFAGTEKVAEWLLSNDQFQEVELSIPQYLIEPTGKTLISFELPDARSPLSLGMGKDKRVLALAFYSVQFEPAQEVLSP